MPNRPNSRLSHPGLHTCLSSGAPIQDHIHHGALARDVYTRGPKLDDDDDKVLSPTIDYASVHDSGVQTKSEV